MTVREGTAVSGGFEEIECSRSSHLVSLLSSRVPSFRAVVRKLAENDWEDAKYHISNFTVVLFSSDTVCVKNAAGVYWIRRRWPQHEKLPLTSDGAFPVIVKLIFDESEN